MTLRPPDPLQSSGNQQAGAVSPVYSHPAPFLLPRCKVGVGERPSGRIEVGRKRTRRGARRNFKLGRQRKYFCT